MQKWELPSLESFVRGKVSLTKIISASHCVTPSCILRQTADAFPRV